MPERKKYKKLSIYKSMVAKVYLASALFVVFFILLFVIINIQESKLKNKAIIQFRKELNVLFELNSSSIKTTIQELSYWDELVTFTKTKSDIWFNLSLNSVENYKISELTIYDLKGKIIKSKLSPNFSNVKIENEVFTKLLKNKYAEYFVQTKNGVVKVYAATIHPSSDSEKVLTKPEGYFFMNQLLDKKYLFQLEQISNSKVLFFNPSDKINIERKKIFTVIDLKNQNNKIIKKMVFVRNYEISFNVVKYLLFLIIIILIVFALYFIQVSRKIIFMPINLITSTLETDFDEVSIEKLKNSSHEFSNIGNLFLEYKNQKTQLILAKEKAQQSDQLKTAFLTNLSHEIRTPMNAIIGFAKLLNTTKVTAAEQKEYLTVIEDSGGNLVLIIEDLIEMSKIETNQLKPNLSKVDIYQSIHKLFGSFEITIPKEKNLQLRIIHPTKNLENYIITDETKLKQIIINLMTNSIKFTNKGFIQLSYVFNFNDNKIHFQITDTGIGIDEEFSKTIFERFRKVESDYTIKGGGLGLGLSIIKAYLEVLKGTISVSSVVGKGTTFNFEIPLNISDVKLTDNITIKKAKIENNSINRIINILIAEDDNINFLLISKILKVPNLNIIRAIDGQNAIDIYNKNLNIDLILMDIKMPILNGYEALIEVRKLNTKIPVIAQTAFSTDDEINKILSSGFTDYITKPLNKDKLFQLLEKYLKN